MSTQVKSANIRRGAAVHHAHHGIGRVQSVGTRRFAGANGTEFAQLYFKRDGLTLIMPLQDVTGVVRSPLDASQASQLLDYLENCAGRCSKQWKARAAAHEQAIQGNDPFEYAEVCKSLSRLEAEGTLRHTDRTHLNRSIELLADELAYALGKTPEHARRLIAKATRTPS